jgi:amino-acid N-acetyltransferase
MGEASTPLHQSAATDPFVGWFRQATPYVHAHRGRTFVIAFGGEAVSDVRFPNLVHDLALLHGLGIRLVLVHGARPQIEERLAQRGAELRYVSGLRITDDEALACVKEAAGVVRVEIEALLSLGLANSPMAGVRIPVASGPYSKDWTMGPLPSCRPSGIRRPGRSSTWALPTSPAPPPSPLERTS